MTARTAGVSAGEMPWRPPADVVQSSRVGQFCSWLAEHRGVEASDHDTLWRWSVDNLDGGSSILIIDGDPAYPDLRWHGRLAEQTGGER